MFSHPAVKFVCRHCKHNINHDPELCIKCGPICDSCFMEESYPCEREQLKYKLLVQIEKKFNE